VELAGGADVGSLFRRGDLPGVLLEELNLSGIVHRSWDANTGVAVNARPTLHEAMYYIASMERAWERKV
jgi:hypothetical protein